MTKTTESPTCQVRVLHNVGAVHGSGRYSTFLPWEPGVVLADVFGFTVEGAPIAAREVAWAVCNSYPEESFIKGYDEVIAAYRAAGCRSLSVGDVLIVDGQAFACDPIGWREVELSNVMAVVTR